MVDFLGFGVFQRFTLLSIFLVGLLATEVSYAQPLESCGRPDFDRTEDRGVFIWQNCGTKEWFFRVTNATQSSGVEVRAFGRLRLSKPLALVEPFSTEPGQDTFDVSDPEQIKFNFRVFGSAQDGFTFKFQNDTESCLEISTIPKMPIVFGANSVRIISPINLETLGNTPCNASSIVGPITLLLE